MYGHMGAQNTLKTAHSAVHAWARTMRKFSVSLVFWKQSKYLKGCSGPPCWTPYHWERSGPCVGHLFHSERSGPRVSEVLTIIILASGKLF